MDVPALVGPYAAITTGYFGPCGFNIPHTHPRAVEVSFVVTGRLFTQMTNEDKSHVTANMLDESSITVFPNGASHTEFNPTCYTSTLVSAFSNVQAESQQVVVTQTVASDNVIRVDSLDPIDGADITKFQDLIPGPIIMGVKACLARCGIPLK